MSFVGDTFVILWGKMGSEMKLFSNPAWSVLDFWRNKRMAFVFKSDKWNLPVFPKCFQLYLQFDFNVRA